MSEEVKTKLESLRRAVEEKLGVTREDFDKEFATTLAETKKDSPSLPPDKQDRKAYLRLQAKYKKDLHSPAKFFTGVFIYNGAVFDTVTAQRDEAEKQFEEDPELAIAERWVDSSGNPVDRQEKYKSGKENRNFGKPLPLHNYIKRLMGVTNIEGETRLFALVMSDNIPIDREPTKMMTKIPVPLFVPVDFRAVIAKTQPDSGILQLNQSRSTEFVPAQNIKVSIMDDVLSAPELDPRKLSPEEVPEWHDAHQEQADRVVVVRGVIFDMDEQRNNQGSLGFTVSSEEADFDFPGLRCWLPESIEPTFEEGDEVIVTGQTSKGTFNDQTTYQLNAGGVYKIT